VLFDGLLSIALAVLVAIGWPENPLAFIELMTGSRWSRTASGTSCCGCALRRDVAGLCTRAALACAA
jgi:hypothetical protein